MTHFLLIASFFTKIIRTKCFSFVAVNLAIVLAGKVGLFKICLGIALVLGTIKLLVFMAWALAIFKYVPDPYIYYETSKYRPNHNLFDYKFGQNDHFKYGYLDRFENHVDRPSSMLETVLSYFRHQ